MVGVRGDEVWTLDGDGELNKADFDLNNTMCDAKNLINENGIF